MPATALWAAPRSRSTAFFRSMLQHGDITALHEPFCNVADFGETEVEGAVVRSERELIDAIRELARHRPVFFKDTTDHRYAEVLADKEFLAGTRHTFLLRRPEEIVSSFYALQPDMELADVGIEGLYEMYLAVLAAGGEPPVVVDSDDLVERPAATMAAYCAAVGIPFRPEALSWDATARGEWQRTDRWHVAVANSTGFSKSRTAYRHTAENNPELARFAAHHRPFYEFLRDARLRVGQEAPAL
ncbi:MULTISPECIES: sulfotransferase family protein [unclassified Streptomyces]|uniref:sulfotransferase-like domain-containing protein n=1 Tax=unclassified Streptomyces TaxID=2593676 RepID=UPI00332C46EE